MIRIVSHQFGETNGYVVETIKTTGELISQRNVIMPLHIVDKDGFKYIILLDERYSIIHEVYKYLNRECITVSYNTRLQKARGLRLLYCFLNISGYDIRSLKRQHLEELVMFLKGTTVTPEEESDSAVLRSNVTVNLYLSVIREYFKFLGVENRALNDAKEIKVSIIDPNKDFTSNVTRIKYDLNRPTSSKNDRMVPKYIGVEQFKKLYQTAAKHNDRTAMILMRLMYAHGLRLGECLGLTVPEDLKEIHAGNKLVPVIVIRNRLSDNPRFQSAKGKMHVTDERQYRTSDYQRDKDQIQIGWDFYNELVDYANETHGYFEEEYPDNYSAGEADIVSTRNKPDYNHYLFLNRYGKVLSDQTWNNTLKLYFTEAGIPLDMDVKEEGLSHRFRHGFAMFHAQFSEHPVDAFKLSKMMRHRSPATTMIYYNPTPEDEAKMKEEAESYLYKAIPELALNMNDLKEIDDGGDVDGDLEDD